MDFVEVDDISPDDMKTLLHATARFGSVVIHRLVVSALQRFSIDSSEIL